MAVHITDACIRCGACEWECPAAAISPTEQHPVVNGSACTECYGFFGESQCMVVCPVSAIAVTEEPVSELAAKFARVSPHAELQDVDIWRRLRS